MEPSIKLCLISFMKYLIFFGKYLLLMHLFVTYSFSLPGPFAFNRVCGNEGSFLDGYQL